MAGVEGERVHQVLGHRGADGGPQAGFTINLVTFSEISVFLFFVFFMKIFRYEIETLKEKTIQILRN